MRLLKSLEQTLTWSMIAITVLSAGVVGTLWVHREYSKFDVESAALRQEYLITQKRLVKQEVNRVLDYITYQRSTTEEALKQQLREQVLQACSLADHLYQTYKQEKTLDEIKAMVREALRPIRFAQGRGYYFIYDMQGKNILLPFTPELEGKNLWDLQDSNGKYTIRRLTELIKNQGEGYLRWTWYQPGNTRNMADKLGFCKLMKPLGWWVGTGEYVAAAEAEIRDKTLERIRKIRFGTDGYIFVYDFQANALAQYNSGLIGTNQWHLWDDQGFFTIQELIRLSRRKEGGFLEYSGIIRPATGLPARKLTYVHSVPQWGWTVGTGVYIDEIDEVIAERKLGLHDKIKRSVAWVFSVLIMSLLLIALVSRLVSQKIALNLKRFNSFFQAAATESTNLDQEKIHFTEFKDMARAANQMIDDRKKAEQEIETLQEQLSRSRKMEALGMLAGGVAHDLNNVLSSVVGYPDLILATSSPEDPHLQYIKAIRASGLRASEIVQDLLTLARRGVLQPTVLNLNHLIGDSLASPGFISLRTNNPSIRVETELAKDLLCVRGSEVHLEKTVMNLIVNAVEAQPEGGLIRVVTENRYLERPLQGYNEVVEGDYVLLSVADEGTGISAEDLEHIFEPFFSKKQLGRSGTGLGMTVVWGTVQDHGGYINVSTTEGEGALFELYFPATREPQQERNQPESLEAYRGSGEWILLVDDIAEQRELAQQMLAGLGYQVKTACSGEEALELLAAGAVDLLVLDMIMHPGMDGLETYRQALRLWPGQKAIIVSGYAETRRVQAAMELGVSRYVKKPYTIRTLGAAITKALHPVARNRTLPE